jgi:hypothetical protein
MKVKIRRNTMYGAQLTIREMEREVRNFSKMAWDKQLCEMA